MDQNFQILSDIYIFILFNTNLVNSFENLIAKQPEILWLCSTLLNGVSNWTNWSRSIQWESDKYAFRFGASPTWNTGRPLLAVHHHRTLCTYSTLDLWGCDIYRLAQTEPSRYRLYCLEASTLCFRSRSHTTRWRLGQHTWDQENATRTNSSEKEDVWVW